MCNRIGSTVFIRYLFLECDLKMGRSPANCNPPHSNTVGDTLAISSNILRYSQEIPENYFRTRFRTTLFYLNLMRFSRPLGDQGQQKTGCAILRIVSSVFLFLFSVPFGSGGRVPYLIARRLQHKDSIPGMTSHGLSIPKS